MIGAGKKFRLYFIKGSVDKQVLMISSISMFSKVIIMGCQLVTMKLFVERLGVEGYAQYAILMSLSGWLLLLDFGFGYALQNKISEKKIIGQDFQGDLIFVVLSSILLFVLTMLIAYLYADTIAQYLLGSIGGRSNSEAVSQYKTLIWLFGLTAIGGIGYKVLYALHLGHWASVAPAIGSIIGLTATQFFLTGDDTGNVSRALLLFSGPNCVIALSSLLYAFSRSELTINIDAGLLCTALKFWLLSILTAATLQTDYLIMSKFLGANSIVIYQVVTKIFSLNFFLYSTFLSVLWPIFSEEIYSGNVLKVKRTAFVFVKISCIGTVVFTGCVLILNDFICDFFLQGKVGTNHISWKLIVMIAVYNLIMLIISVFSVALQSANITKVFLISIPVQALISIFCQIYFVPIWGLYGVVAGLMLSYMAVPLWLIPYKFFALCRIENEKNTVSYSKL